MMDMNATTKLLAEDTPGIYLNRHPHSTQTYRHGKTSMARGARTKGPVGEVTVRKATPAERVTPRKPGFPHHLMGR